VKPLCFYSRIVITRLHFQETLVLDLNEEKAKAHFRAKMKEALNNSWKTSVNWAIHNQVRDNT